MRKAIQDVAAERNRQITDEGFDAAHDDLYTANTLSSAAIAYAMPDNERDVRTANGFQLWRVFWPWEKAWFKPKDRRSDLVKAAALLIAEIESIDRAEAVRAATE